MALVVFCFGAVRPLADPDLPMHLAVGEWIVRHHAVPWLEPFAWTRAGEPYFAYSWLSQIAFFSVFERFGHLGLRALQGCFMLASAGAVVVMARAARLRPSQAIMLAGLNLIVAAFFVALLRPQSILLVTLPLIWAAVLWLGADEHPVLAPMVLFLASSLTANVHLFFPLTLAPLAWFGVRAPSDRRRIVLAAVCVIAAWFTSPYALHWVAVFRHNFGPNYLYRPPSAITELQPGFVNMIYPSPGPMVALVMGMLVVPWVLTRAPLEPRARILAALYWSGGVVLFGYATRLFLAWWLLALLPVAWAVTQLTGDTEEAPPRLRFRLLGLVACLLVLAAELSRTRDLWALEGTTRVRTLPTVNARPAERIAEWLERNAAPSDRVKVFTTFSFGSYVTWRLPGYSASIDSRGVFPDSVAAAEAVVLASDQDVPLGPWRSADIAILPVRYRSAAVLDTAAGWHRALTVPGFPIVRDSAALWISAAWWAKNGDSARGARR